MQILIVPIDYKIRRSPILIRDICTQYDLMHDDMGCASDPVIFSTKVFNTYLTHNTIVETKNPGCVECVGYVANNDTNSTYNTETQVVIDDKDESTQYMYEHEVSYRIFDDISSVSRLGDNIELVLEIPIDSSSISINKIKIMRNEICVLLVPNAICCVMNQYIRIGYSFTAFKHKLCFVRKNE